MIIIDIPPRGVVRNTGSGKTPSQCRFDQWGRGGGVVNIQNTATHTIGEWWGSGPATPPPANQQPLHAPQSPLKPAHVPQYPDSLKGRQNRTQRRTWRLWKQPHTNKTGRNLMVATCSNTMDRGTKKGAVPSGTAPSRNGRQRSFSRTNEAGSPPTQSRANSVRAESRASHRARLYLPCSTSPSGSSSRSADTPSA